MPPRVRNLAPSRGTAQPSNRNLRFDYAGTDTSYWFSDSGATRLAAAVPRPRCWPDPLALVRRLPPAHLFINSPYDPEARHGGKRDLTWVEHTAHLTQTCDPDEPQVATAGGI